MFASIFVTHAEKPAGADLFKNDRRRTRSWPGWIVVENAGPMWYHRRTSVRSCGRGYGGNVGGARALAVSGWFGTMQWFWRWRHATGLLLGLFCGLACGAQGAAAKFEVGQRWVYRHEGPRPGSVEPNVIDGQRILHVISRVEEQDETTWVIEETFTNSMEVIGRLYVDEARRLTALDIENDKGEVAALYYDPPVPYQVAEMDVGRAETIETTLRVKSADFALPSTITIRRLENETITTPAGEFADCLHYTVTSRSTIDIKLAKIRITEQRRRWYHPRVHGLVKEVYRREPVRFLTWSRDGYTATSVLTTFDNVPVPVQAHAPSLVARTEKAPREPMDSPAPASSHATTYVVVLGVLAVFGATGYGLVKRARKKRPAQARP